jgi:glycosyltransferase involved in cell wall biosynthesis
MVTADREFLCRRAIGCYESQTYPWKELVVVDDGDQDLSPLLAGFPELDIKYHRLAKDPKMALGGLRNVGLEHARGDYVVQWDDDDWYHPERIEKQLRALGGIYDSCTLTSTLLHVGGGPHFLHPFTGSLKNGVPGTLMHRRAPAPRYPNQARGEDTSFLEHWTGENHVTLPEEDSYLFIRCFHNDNTWNEAHFLRRLRNTPLRLLTYLWCKYVLRDVHRHPAFRLTTSQRQSFERFVAESRALGLL